MAANKKHEAPRGLRGRDSGQERLVDKREGAYDAVNAWANDSRIRSKK